MRNVIFSWTASVDEKGTPEEVGTGGASQPTQFAQGTTLHPSRGS